MEYLKIDDFSLTDDLQNFQIFFDKISLNLDLDKNWSHKKAIKNEIIKSYVRGLIRESNFSKNIISQALIEIKKQNFFQDHLFITKAYPMIHLQNDIFEAGNFHNDQIGNEKMFTCWIPFTDYEYPALSFTNFKKKKFILFNRVLNKLNLIDYFSHNIYVKKNEIYLWDARLFHKGNVNLSEKITCAIQFKITSKPFLYERSKKIILKKKMDTFNYEHEFNSSSESIILNNYNDYIDLVDRLLSIKSDEEFNYEIMDIINNKNKTKITSFALSVLSQRLLLLEKRSSEYKKYKKICNYIDLSSLICGAENLISLERIKNSNLYQLFSKSAKSDLMIFIKNYNQSNLILNNQGFNSSENYFSF